MLQLLAEKPRHGYEIIKAIEERSGDTYSPSPGVIYPTLTMLEELGHAAVTEAAGKRLYTLASTGEAILRDNQRAADAAMARIAGGRGGSWRWSCAADRPGYGEPSAGTAPAPVPWPAQ